MRLFLLGYMGSGKTTIAKSLSKKLSVDLIDTDAHIELQERTTIKDIFKERGEDSFRILEKNLLHSLKSQENIIVATGGGLPCLNNNMEQINSLGTSFYICLNPKNLAHRLFTEKSNRPLISHFRTEESLLAFITKELQKREKFYFQSNFILNGNQDISELIADIEKFIST